MYFIFIFQVYKVDNTYAILLCYFIPANIDDSALLQRRQLDNTICHLSEGREGESTLACQGP